MCTYTYFPPTSDFCPFFWCDDNLDLHVSLPNLSARLTQQLGTPADAV